MRQFTKKHVESEDTTSSSFGIEKWAKTTQDIYSILDKMPELEQ